MLLLLALATVNPDIRLVTRHGQQYIQDRKGRYAIEGEMPMSLDDGTLVNGPRVTFDGGWLGNLPPGRRAAKSPEGCMNCGMMWHRPGGASETIDFQPVITDWLKDDAIWGGHADANTMRYMAGLGGIYGEIHQVVQQKDRTALAVLSIHFAGPSGEPIGAQFLMRLLPNPFRMERVRPLRADGSDYRSMGTPVLMQFGKHLLSVDDKELDDTAPDGKVIAKWLDLPAHSDVKGIAGRRWLITYLNTGPNQVAYLACDLNVRKPFPILTFTYDDHGRVNPPQMPGFPNPSSPYLVFQSDPGGEKAQDFTIHLPDGKRTRLAGMAYMTAGPYAWDRNDDGFVVYSAVTGKLITKNLK